MDKKISIKTISVKDLWNVFRGCFIYVIVVAILVTAGMYAYAKVNYVPMYSSKATVYLINKTDKKVEAEMADASGEEGKEGFDLQEFTIDYTIALKVIDDVNYIIKSPRVMKAVSKDVGVPVSGGSISIVNPENTRVLEITATANSAELAQKIVNSVCTIGADAVEEIIQYNRMYVYEAGTLNTWPSNTVSLFGYAKFGILAALLVYVVFLCMFLFDNYIHTEEDIERYLGLTILGDIPDANAPKKKNKYSRYDEKSYKNKANSYGYMTDDSKKG